MFVDSFSQRLRSKLHKRSPSPEAQDQPGPDEPRKPRGTPAYPYRELDGSDVRLLRILPGGEQDSIECQLDQVPLSTNPTYYTLSYVWGDPFASETIILDGHPFQITSKLYEALHQFRQLPDLGYLDDYFWIDAICINQGNIAEKSREVPRMMEIYQSCLQVLVWLGPNGPPSSGAVRRLLRKSASYWSWMACWKRSDRIINPKEQTPDDVVEDMFEKADLLIFSLSEDGHDDAEVLQRTLGPSYNAILKASMEILRRPWFSRTWTVQEACVNTNPLIYAGRHGIELQYLISFLRVLRMQHRFLYLSPGIRRIVALDEIRNMYMAIHTKDDEYNPTGMQTAAVFCRLLRATGTKASTDPRDQLYGLVGLLDFFGRGIPAELAPDYGLPYEQVYWNYAAYLFERTGDLRLLNCQQNGLRGVPSWVPDFRHTRFLTNAAQESSSAWLSPDKRTLHLQGLPMGAIRDHVAQCAVSEIQPSLRVIPTGLSCRILDVEKRILEPAAAIRGVSREKTLEGLMADTSRAFNAGGPDSARRVYCRLREPSGGGRNWLTRRRATMDILGKEVALAGEFSHSFLLLADGTIVRLGRLDVEIEPGDVVCLFKGAMLPSVVRPNGEDYTFLCQCEIKSGTLNGQAFDDEFWDGKELEEYRMV